MDLPMKKTENELSTKVVSGFRQRARPDSLWERFDRLQRSLRPLRKGRHPVREVSYGRGP